MYFVQDKYILGSMFILFGCCVWHSIVGALINRLTPIVGPATTIEPNWSSGITHTTGNYTTKLARAIYTTAVTSTTISPPSTTTIPPPTPTAQLADYIALAIFLTIYMVFHLVFAVLIFCEVCLGMFTNNVLNSPIVCSSF